MNKNKIDTREIIREVVNDEIGILDEDTNNQNTNHQNTKKFWISDMYDNLYETLDFYIIIDDRLKCISMSEILNSPFSLNTIAYDNTILDFINDFINIIDSQYEIMKRKEIEIMENDRQEFNKLLSLNKNKIYSRISYCIEKWYIN